VTANVETAAPFLKWAGGKRWLVSRFPHLLPNSFSKYFEPFLGSGAVFFWLKPKRGGIISDVNSDLINAYKEVRNHPDKLLLHLRAHQRDHDDNHYYLTREKIPHTDVGRAARLIYLNRTCWNGLYRVNQLGQFNVPRGTKNLVISEDETFKDVSSALQRIKIRNWDFEKTIDAAGKDDFLFVDPPYTVKHNFNGFAKYNEKIFNWQDQIRLAQAIERASSRGAKILVTNADHASVRALYEGIGEIRPLPRTSIISGSNIGRGSTTEIAVTVNYTVAHVSS
jgi:DNA adenine methylase